MPTKRPSDSLFSPPQLLAFLKRQQPQMLAALADLVRLESPSLEKVPTDSCCEFLAGLWRKAGTTVRLHKQKQRGNHLCAEYTPPSPPRDAQQLLILGHYDTVYPSGTLQTMPFHISGRKAYGPGIFDMKAGIIQALFALRAIRELRLPLRHRLVFLWTSDEEIGSSTSRSLIEDLARKSAAVFVLEPSLGLHGHLKTSRKGVGEAKLIVHGRASHAGLAPEKGINAIHELAAQIARIEKWNDLRRGITINADIVSGGSRTNVIADRAEAVFDLRAWRLADMRALEKRLRSLKPIHKGARLELLGGFDRPPFEQKQSATLFAKAQALAKTLGFTVNEAAAGGGSDGNLTAALGVPTLDGLGAVGDAAHSREEHILTHTLAPRAALLASLLASS